MKKDSDSRGYVCINKERRKWAVFHPHVKTFEEREELKRVFGEAWDVAIKEAGSLLIIFTEGCDINEDFFTSLFKDKISRYYSDRVPMLRILRSIEFDTRTALEKEEGQEFLTRLFVNSLHTIISGGLHDKN